MKQLRELYCKRSLLSEQPSYVYVYIYIYKLYLFVVMSINTLKCNWRTHLVRISR